MSEHREYRQDIAALAAGRLEGPARERLVEHVSTCESCAVVLEAARGVAEVLERRDDAGRGLHPRVSSLLEYASGMGPQERESIRLHLEHCDSCRLEVEASRRRRLADGPRPGEGPRSDRASRRWLVAAGVFAAGTVVGLLGHPVVDRAPGPVEWSGVVASLIVGPAERGAHVDERVVLEPRQLGLPVVIYLQWLDAPSELGPLEVRVRHLGGGPVWSTTIAAAAAASLVESGGPITVVVPSSRLVDGSYELTLSRTNGREPAPLAVQRFDVTVSSQSP